MLVVTEAAEAALAEQLVERLLAGVAERRGADIVANRDRLGQILVQAQRPRDAARDPGRLERVREPGAEVVALRVDEDLRLVAQPPERLRVDDPVAVALERSPQAAFVLRSLASSRLVRAHGERREPLLFVLANRVGEAVRDLSGDLRHRRSAYPARRGAGSGLRTRFEMKHGLPDRAGRHDPASSVARIALLFTLPASLSRTRPSHPVSACVNPKRVLNVDTCADAPAPPSGRPARRRLRLGQPKA